MAKSNDRSARDKERAAYLKAHKIERHGGICPVCYRPIPNDTFGGSGAYHHFPGSCCGIPKD